MSVQFQNFEFSFLKNDRPIFVPTKLGRKIGQDLNSQLQKQYSFDRFYHHFGDGGHIAALHRHRLNKFFARLDIERFFYSIGRNRVVRALRGIGVQRATHYGKWSCVKNPYDLPRYALPYGFVQSPILASLVLAESPAGHLLRCLSTSFTVSVYMDDISLSGNDELALTRAFGELCDAVEQSGFSLNRSKLCSPTQNLVIFNCDLQNGLSRVQATRITKFFSTPRSEDSARAFRAYCASVEGQLGIA
jgi:nitroimidazol reductase NimA-like FMN-containing flavoprotein (pyridoxamine 5'-phosphate oxidase superfamily)